MKEKFDRKEHVKKHKDRIAQIRKNIRERKIIGYLKEEIKQRRESVTIE
ncbi:hypothetical protein LCGC14_1534340 [marine sediment metagenome]|uniref:Uncharacterized protein n=1 Tax=marine sediment metagenome TaxID=412755 RepID=A0A0F9IV21_9ZZZZ